MRAPVPRPPTSAFPLGPTLVHSSTAEVGAVGEDPLRVGNLPFPVSALSMPRLDGGMSIPPPPPPLTTGGLSSGPTFPHRPNSVTNTRGNNAGFLAAGSAGYHQDPTASAVGERKAPGSSGSGGAASVKENTGRWTMEEHNIFLEGLKLHGKGWKQIAQMIKSRTVVQIRTHAQKYFQKLAKAQQNGNMTGEVTMDTRGGPSTSTLPIPVPKGGGGSSVSPAVGSAGTVQGSSGHGAAGSGAGGKKRKKGTSKRKTTQAGLDCSDPSSGRRKMASQTSRGGAGSEPGVSKRLAINISKLKSSINSPSPSSVMDAGLAGGGGLAGMPPELFPRDAGVEIENLLVDTAALDWLASDGHMGVTSSGSSSSMSESSSDDTSDSERETRMLSSVDGVPFSVEPGLDLIEQTIFDPNMDDEEFVSVFLGDSDWP